MKDLVELFKFLKKKFGSFTITVDTNYEEEGDLALFVNVGTEEFLEFEDLKKIRKFCDELSINTNQEGKLFLSLLFLPKKDGVKE